jgi:hypothetical protein
LSGPFVSDSADNLDAAVGCVLSRLIGEYRSQDAGDIEAMNRALWYFAAAPDLPAGQPPWPCGAHIVLRDVLGVSRLDLNADWERRRHRDGVFRAYDAELLHAFFPPASYSTVRELVCLGPAEAVSRSEAALYAYSQRTVRPNRARPKGGLITHRSINAMMGSFRRLIALVCELNALGHPAAELRVWAHPLKVRPPHIAPVETDRSAPPLALVRKELQRLEGELRKRLRWSGGSELAAVGALSTIQLSHAGVWRLARYRLLVALVATLGPRIGAFAELRVADYDPKHEFPDGEVGPALALRPGKNEHHELVRWKGITAKEQEIIDVFLRISDRLYAEREPTLAHNSYRLLPEPRALPEGRYLLASEIWRPEKKPCAQAMSNRLSGLPGCGVKPLLAKPPLDGVQQRGYSSHTVRHLSEQLVKAAARTWLSGQNIAHVTEQAISDAVHDHRIKDDVYGYSDVGSEVGRELWSRVGIRLASELIWTSAGAHRVPDVATFERTFRRQLALEGALRREAGRVAAIQRVAAEKRESAGHQDVLALLTATNAERQARIALDEARTDCERLRNDRTSWLVVEDPADAPQVTLEEVEGQLRVGTSMEPVGSSSRVRVWLTVTELAKLYGVSTATARRWVKPGCAPKHLPRLRVDLACGPKRRRIPVGWLEPERLTAGQSRMLRELLSRWPLEENWSRSDCETPLVDRHLQAVAEDGRGAHHQAASRGPRRVA